MLRARVYVPLLFLIVCLAFATAIFAQTPSVTVLGNDTLTFEEAGGRVGSGQAAFTSSVSSQTFQFYESRASIDVARADGKPIRLGLSGASPRAHLSPEGLLPGIVNYFPSPDTSIWRTNLRTWSGLRYQGIYPGIDLVYYGNRGQLEYDFVVAPQHDPQSIALEIGRAQRVSMAQDGGLNISGSGTSPPQTITQENFGNATLTLSAVSNTGPFLISASTCGTTLAPGVSMHHLH